MIDFLIGVLVGGIGGFLSGWWIRDGMRRNQRGPSLIEKRLYLDYEREKRKKV